MILIWFACGLAAGIITGAVVMAALASTSAAGLRDRIFQLEQVIYNNGRTDG
jgi:hypothetical protein